MRFDERSSAQPETAQTESAAASRISYVLTPADLHAHIYRVQLRVELPDRAGQLLSLPAWTPGSYLIRDHARHIVALTANCNGVPVAVQKLDKQRWRCAPCQGALTVEYEVYAFDESVRAAYLDAAQGFFDGAALWLRVHGQEEQPHELELRKPEHASWQLATSLSARERGGDGFGHYRADSYTELIDHPALMGELTRIPFEAQGVPHEIVFSGRQQVDAARLAQDLSKICSEHIQLFGVPAPMQHYLFLTRVMHKGYGGLEHRNCSSLVCARGDLPQASQPAMSAAYRSFLGLASHEYFHLWNVKRIQPPAFKDSDLTQEAYTRDLWAYEGITSYYDDLALVRSSVISAPEYLDLLAQTVTRLWRTPGRARQTLAEASFDAWIKFYRADENTANSQISYYNKGALAALCLDMKLRLLTHSACSLDDVMRALWQRYGLIDQPAPEGMVENIAAELCRTDLKAFFDELLRSTADPPLQELLQQFGVDCRLRIAQSESDAGGRVPESKSAVQVELGLRLANERGRSIITQVLAGGPAQIAGLHPGDELLALDGLRCESVDLTPRLLGRQAGEKLQLQVFRRDELQSFTLTLAPKALDTWVLTLTANPSPEILTRRQNWLGN
ncbi:MAG: M61 family metallopeptidase [Nevskiales bacterium]